MKTLTLISNNMNPEIPIKNYDELNKRAFEIRFSETKKSIELSQKALELASNEGENRNILKATTFSKAILGDAHTILGNYDKGMIYANQALQIYETHGWLEESIFPLATIAHIYHMLSDDTSCLEYCIKLLNRAELFGELEWKAIAIQKMGAAYSHKGEFKKALQSHQEALDLYIQLEDIDKQAQILNNFCIEYQMLGQYKDAIKYGKKSLNYFQKTENIFGIAKIYINLSDCYREIDQLETALEYSHFAIKLLQDKERKSNYTHALNQLGKLYFQTQEYHNAKEFFNKAVRIGEKTNNYQDLKTSHQYLAKTYKQLGYFEKAIYHFEKHAEIVTLDTNQSAQRRYNNLEILFRTDKAIIEERTRANKMIREAYDLSLEGWASALELHSKETEGHSRRVADLSVRFAEELGYSLEEVINVRRGALLHDIGKMGIPERILQKVEKLSLEDWEIIKQHPTNAVKMLSPIKFLEFAIDIPQFHHENWDGTGYPLGLSGNEIPEPARFFAIIDNWDALTSDRPYRRAWSKEKTMDYIDSQSGLKFDPFFVPLFLKSIINVKYK